MSGGATLQYHPPSGVCTDCRVVTFNVTVRKICAGVVGNADYLNNSSSDLRVFLTFKCAEVMKPLES